VSEIRKGFTISKDNFTSNIKVRKTKQYKKPNKTRSKYKQWSAIYYTEK
jgi:hypothetical protein